MAKAIGDYASRKTQELRGQAAEEADASRQQALLDEAARWDEGGVYRVAAHAAAGGLAGGVAGAAGAGVSAAAVPLVDDALKPLDLPQPVSQALVATYEAPADLGCDSGAMGRQVS
jgi:filamentous hemagglutinin